MPMARTEGIAARDQLETRLGAVERRSTIRITVNTIFSTVMIISLLAGCRRVSLRSGADAPVYMNDHSLAERPVTASLGEEISRVVRGRRKSEMD